VTRSVSGGLPICGGKSETLTSDLGGPREDSKPSQKCHINEEDPKESYSPGEGKIASCRKSPFEIKITERGGLPRRGRGII